MLLHIKSLSPHSKIILFPLKQLENSPWIFPWPVTPRHSLDSRITAPPRVMSGPVSHLSTLVNKPRIPGAVSLEASKGPPVDVEFQQKSFCVNLFKYSTPPQKKLQELCCGHWVMKNEKRQTWKINTQPQESHSDSQRAQWSPGDGSIDIIDCSNIDQPPGGKMRQASREVWHHPHKTGVSNSSFFGVQRCSKAIACSCYSILQSMIFLYFMTFMTFWLWHFKLEVGCFLLRGSEGIASRFSPAERSHYYMLQKYTATGRVLVDKRRWMIPFLVVVRQLDYTPHPQDLGLDSPARWHFIRNVHALRHNYFMLNTQMVEVEWIPFSCVSAPIVPNTLKRKIP